MIAAIAAAEIAFWVLLLGGLALRYGARTERASTLVLRTIPLVDVALVLLVVVDVARGAPPTRAHAFAAVYLGITVAFGAPTIAWADAWFRHRFAGGPRPPKPEKGSREESVALWREWFRVLLAAGIAASGILALVLIDGGALPADLESAAEHPYWNVLLLTGMVVVIWFFAGPAFAGSRRGPDR